jgi:hypothetical protein
LARTRSPSGLSSSCEIVATTNRTGQIACVKMRSSGVNIRAQVSGARAASVLAVTSMTSTASGSAIASARPPAGHGDHPCWSSAASVTATSTPAAASVPITTVAIS